jgi:hypothetical protein
VQRQPLRQVPAPWREEILAAARAEADGLRRKGNRKLTLAATDRGADWTIAAAVAQGFAPSRWAWGALAAVWVVIAVLRFGARDTTAVLAEEPAARPVELRMAMEQHRRLLAELIGQIGPPESEPAAPVAPEPRSARREETAVA